MTKKLTDRLDVDLACPKCSKIVKQTLAQIQKEPTLTCPSCGNRFKVRNEGREAFGKLNELDRLLSGFGKKR